MAEDAPELSVVVPAFDEAACVVATLRSIVDLLTRKGLSFEVLAVDDGSRDRTLELMKEVAATEPRLRVIANGGNRGKGFSVRAGMLASRGNFVLFTDADSSTPIEEVSGLLDWAGRGFDVVIGSREVKGSDVGRRQPRHRELVGRIFNALVRLSAFGGISDTQCGFKLFSRAAAQRIFSVARVDGYCFDVEALLLAKRFGFKIKEAPVIWNDSGRSHLSLFGDAPGMLLDLLKIRRGTYDV